MNIAVMIGLSALLIIAYSLKKAIEDLENC